MSNRLIFSDLITLAAVAERTASGAGSAVNVLAYKSDAKIIFMCAAVSGTTPTLDLTIQDSADGSTDWTDTDIVFAQVTASDIEVAIDSIIGDYRKFIRAEWVITGTSPVYQFGVGLLAN